MKTGRPFAALPKSLPFSHKVTYCVADISGIQSYIFHAMDRHTTAGQVRSRSAYVESLGPRLQAILEKQFGPAKTQLYRAPENRPAEETFTIRPPRQQYLIVDGYNIIFAWDALAVIARDDLDAARRKLMDALSSYAGYKKCRLVLVFDGYKVKGNPGTREQFHNIQVVYTGEGETADAYIEALVAQIGTNYAVRVATSDGLVQLSSLRSGVLRMSARELQAEVAASQKDMQKYF